MTKKEYNGWTNYETWAVNLWMDNEESSQRYYSQMADRVWGRTCPIEVFNKSEAARFRLADIIKDEYEEGQQQMLEVAKVQASVWADLLNAALSEVNWAEIANSLLEANCEGYEPHAETANG